MRYVCSLCGRVGTRQFLWTMHRPFTLICKNTKACEQRVRLAESNWCKR